MSSKHAKTSINTFSFLEQQCCSLLLFWLLTLLKSKFNKKIDIKNQNGQMKAIREIPSRIEDKMQVTKSSYLLDYATGDLVQFNTHTHKWESRLNYGIHNEVEMINESALFTKKRLI